MRLTDFPTEAIAIITSAAVSIFSVALPAILEHFRVKREFKYRRTQIYLDNKFSAYQDLISAYSYPRFDLDKFETRLDLKRAIFRAISVSERPLAEKLEQLLVLVDSPAVSFHENFQPTFLQCLSMINQEYTSIVETLKP